jgi:hypothetical protein
VAQQVYACALAQPAQAAQQQFTRRGELSPASWASEAPPDWHAMSWRPASGQRMRLHRPLKPDSAAQQRRQAEAAASHAPVESSTAQAWGQR